MRRLSLSIGAAFLVARVALAAPGLPVRLDLDAAASRIDFRLPGTLHETRGTFRVTRGRIIVAADGRGATGEIVVDAASGASGLDARDERMRSVVLESGTHPEIRFRPSSVDGGVGDDGTLGGTIRGVLDLHGGEHEIEIPVEGRVSGDAVTAVGRFAVPYVAWGLEDPSVLFLAVGDVVEIEAHVVGRLAPAEETGR